MKKLLLHACCAPCGAYSAKFLAQQGYDVTFYFYNPNIFPKDEYKRRLDELIRFANDEKFSLIVAEPDFEEWNLAVIGHENAPEKGSRCHICYKMRLAHTAKYAKENGFDAFTTTLSISPHKSYEMISEISRELEKALGIQYLDVNLKKQDGFKKSLELSRLYGFYRQDYCGCKYSKQMRENQSRAF